MSNPFWGVRSQAQRDTALDSMSDKLQFVDASMESGLAADDKLKFIGHKAPSPLRFAGAPLSKGASAA